MSEAENKTPEAFAAADLQQECASLRKQVNLLFISLVVVSLTLTAFLGLQFWRTSKELAATKPQAMQIIEVRKKEGPIVQSFMGKIAEYAQTHPEFAARLARQGLKLGANTNTSGSASPAPVIAPPDK